MKSVSIQHLYPVLENLLIALRMVAEYTGAKLAVVCVNGTNALHMAMLMWGVERDDEVITQPLSFNATANAISYIGASAVFLDVDPAGVMTRPV